MNNGLVRFWQTIHRPLGMERDYTGTATVRMELREGRIVQMKLLQAERVIDLDKFGDQAERFTAENRDKRF